MLEMYYREVYYEFIIHCYCYVLNHEYWLNFAINEQLRFNGVGIVAMNLQRAKHFRTFATFGALFLFSLIFPINTDVNRFSTES